MRSRHLFALLACTALLGGATTAGAVASAPRVSVPIEASLLDGGLQHGFVQLDRTATSAQVAALLAAGAVKVHPFRLAPQVAFVAPSAAVRALAAVPGAVRVTEDHGISLDLDESKKALGVTDARAPKPKGLGLTGKGVRVAVIDTGIDASHPDVADSLFAAYNTEFAWITEAPQDGVYGNDAFALTAPYGSVDENGHGTHVATTVAGSGKAAKDAGRTEDLSGVAPGAELVTYKIAGASQTGADLGWEMNAMVAIEHIVEHPELKIRVVSNSWSIYEVDDPDVEPTIQVIRAAARRGITFVFAASNDGPKDETVGWPGATGEVITVASTVKTAPYAVSSFSSRGYQVDVAAPGSSITAGRSTLASYTPASRLGSAAPFYAAISGTSMATPHVAGVVALLYQAAPRLTSQQVTEVLERSTRDLGEKGKDHSYGWGFVDALKAGRIATCLNAKPGSEACFTAHKAMPKKQWKLDWDDKGNLSKTSQS